MKVIEPCRLAVSSLSERAKVRMQQCRGEPLFVADWDKVLMIHFAVDEKQLQRDVPFALDLRQGCAFVTLVAFTLRDMRLAFGGSLTSWVFRSIATHDFLNVRTYVRVGGEEGIHFLAEWVSNRIALALGPRTFSLPYRYGKISYQNDWNCGELSGRIEDAGKGAALAYLAHFEANAPFSTCEPDSRDEWLMERYSAFNAACGRKRFFRVWHDPWWQCNAQVQITDASLLKSNWEWFGDAEFAGANYSPCVRDVWLGRPRRVPLTARSDNVTGRNSPVN